MDFPGPFAADIDPESSSQRNRWTRPFRVSSSSWVRTARPVAAGSRRTCWFWAGAFTRLSVGIFHFFSGKATSPGTSIIRNPGNPLARASRQSPVSIWPAPELPDATLSVPPCPGRLQAPFSARPFAGLVAFPHPLPVSPKLGQPVRDVTNIHKSRQTHSASNLREHGLRNSGLRMVVGSQPDEGRGQTLEFASAGASGHTF